MLLHFAITSAAEIKRRYHYAKFMDCLHNKSNYTEEARNDERFNSYRFKPASRVKLNILLYRVPLSPGNYRQYSRLLAKSKLLCLALLLVGCDLSKSGSSGGNIRRLSGSPTGMLDFCFLSRHNPQICRSPIRSEPLRTMPSGIDLNGLFAASATASF